MFWVVPVMYEASSLERKTNSAAMSSAVACRPRGIEADSAASRSASVAPARMSVSAAPGETEVQVMPYGASSRAIDRVDPRAAAVAAEHGGVENTPPPRCPETEGGGS